MSVARADELYEAVRKLLPPDSFTRDLWEAMYVQELTIIEEQMEFFGLDARSRIDTARKLIKRVAREVFEKFGLTFTEARHQGRRHAAK